MEQFDAVVVGAGLAGLSCAYSLAQEGLSVLVVERGDYPGAKNVTGGRIYAHSLRQLLPDLWDEAPFERHVAKETLVFMNEENSVSVNLASGRFDNPPYHSYTVLRAKFDQWLAAKAEEAGAMIVSKMQVDNLLQKEGKVCGIVADGDEVEASVVVAADGVNSLLARGLGLAANPSPKNYAVGVKELIQLPKGVIEDRFNLDEDEGAAALMVGYPSKGLKGGGFIYTNKDSLSLGVVVEIGSVVDSTIEVSELTENLKAHPTVKKLIKGGKTVEYAAHLIPEASWRELSALSTDGFLVVGDAAGLCLNLGITVRGMDYAIASGILAAQAIKKAKERDDFSKESLSLYDGLLQASFVVKDIQTFSKVNQFLDNKRFYQQYPDFLCSALEKLFYFDGQPKGRLSKTLQHELLGKVSLLGLLGDAISGYRSL